MEHSTFNPLFFACTGAAGPSASKVMSRLVLKISGKGHDSYSDAISFIRTKISFALLRSSVLCLRGCRALKRQIDHVESSIATTVQGEGCRELWKSHMGAYPEVSFLTFSINFGVLLCKSVLHLMRFDYLYIQVPLLTLQGGSAACSDSALSHLSVIKLPLWTMGHHSRCRPT